MKGTKGESRPDVFKKPELYLFFMPAEFRKDRRDIILYQSACAVVREEGLPISRATTHLFSDPAILTLALRFKDQER